MAGRYDRNPFDEQDEVNPFAVSFLLFSSLKDFTPLKRVKETPAFVSLKASFFELGFLKLVYLDLINLT